MATLTILSLRPAKPLALAYVSFFISLPCSVLVGTAVISSVVNAVLSLCSWGDELGSSCVEPRSSCVIGSSACVESIVDCDEPPFGCVESIEIVGSIGLSLAGSSSPQRVG